MIMRVLMVLLLTVIYTLTLASLQLWDIVTGLLIAVVLVAVSGQMVFGAQHSTLALLLRRMVAFVPFALAVIWDIIKGTWQVSLIVMHLRPLARPGIVTVPIGERTPLGVAVSGLTVTLSPGAFLVDVDWEQRLILYHCIDASNPEAFRAEQASFYERYQRHVFP
jgi:multisubunit Na+/H+ antiporter MnhE subunit